MIDSKKWSHWLPWFVVLGVLGCGAYLHYLQFGALTTKAHPAYDFGLWRMHLFRYFLGDTPYQDFAFSYPPTSIYLLGELSRLLGPSLTATFGISLLLTAIICILFTKILRHVFANVYLVVAVQIAGLLFYLSVPHGLMNSFVGSNPPAVIIGHIFLLGALLVIMKYESRNQVGAGAATGLCLSLAFLSKHEFWIPVLLVLGFCLARTVIKRNWRFGFSSLIFFGLTLTVGVLLFTPGLAVSDLISGFGMTQWARWMPSGLAVVTQIVVGAIWTALLASLYWVTTKPSRPRWILPAISLSAALAFIGCLTIT